MAAGSTVLRYDGKRGVVWRIRFRDADGRMVTQTLGSERDGWTRRRAKEALQERQADVRRDAWRRPDPLSFESFTAEWLDQHIAARGLKTTTADSYATIVNRHLNPWFADTPLHEVSLTMVERYLREKQQQGLAPASLHRHLAILSLLFGAAIRRRIVRENPIPFVQRTRPTRWKWRIIAPAEFVAVGRAFQQLAEEADTEEERADLIVAGMMFQTAMLTGLRRGELLGLEWRHVHLADGRAVRGRVDTPKSEAGQRTISLGRTMATALFDYRAEAVYAGDGERVFPNPRTGGAFNAARYGDLFRAALKRAGVEGRVRPFHDLRHSSITNAAAAGTSPEALMSRAGHSDYATTRRYIDLSGQVFREEADMLEARLNGSAVNA